MQDELREMVADDIGIGEVDLIARSIVKAIFKDLLGRRFLKWLFDEGLEGHQICAGVDALEPETIREIKGTWEKLVATHIRALAIRNAKDNASYTGECICPKCGIRHGGTVSEGKF